MEWFDLTQDPAKLVEIQSYQTKKRDSTFATCVILIHLKGATNLPVKYFVKLKIKANHF
jgi:hypothetical protein